MRAAVDSKALRRNVMRAATACASLWAASYTGVVTWDRARPAVEGAAELTVMTYNVNFGVAGDASTLDAIAGGGADVVLLQETNAAWERSMRARLGGTYPHMRFGAPESMPAGGLAVLSRWPFEVTHASPSDGGFFYAWRVVVHTPRGDVQALNVHLRPQVSDEGSLLVGRFTTGPNRLRELTRHRATLSRALPTLVAGDFNEDERGDAVRSLTDAGMRSALVEFAPGAMTWRWPVGPFTVRQRFDHVVYDPARFECLHARVSPAGASDHLPVIARLRWRAPS